MANSLKRLPLNENDLIIAAPDVEPQKSLAAQLKSANRCDRTGRDLVSLADLCDALR